MKKQTKKGVVKGFFGGVIILLWFKILWKIVLPLTRVFDYVDVYVQNMNTAAFHETVIIFMFTNLMIFAIISGYILHKTLNSLKHEITDSIE